MISGDKDMLVIDPQFSLSEAHRLAAEILESKKNLVTIYVTHPHPDHLFGLAVLHQAFPSARIVALPATVNAAKTGWPARQKFWFPTYGNNIPGPEPVLPDELTTPVLTLEGENLPITGAVALPTTRFRSLLLSAGRCPVCPRPRKRTRRRSRSGRSGLAPRRR